MFTGRLIRGIKNRQSPEWMRKRLRAVGLRPINALVDVTNYISYDRARPLHVYDADKLRGAIRARLGKEGETFLALDDAEYEVDETMCVIADKKAVLGLGGVIGGADTGCTEATENVFIESAYFDPVRTAMTGRKTGVLSDARFRFERGIDPTSHTLGANLATAMVLKFCGGEPSRLKQAGETPARPGPIAFDPREVKRLTGVDLKPAQITKTLTKLGFKVAGREPALEVATPGWRPDVAGSADLVEEVIRIAGVDKVPAVALPRLSGVAKPVLTAEQKRVSRARRLLAARGMAEAVNWAFIPKAQAEMFGGGARELELANPISTDMSDMRPSLLPGLLTAARNNANRGFRDCALFEIGNTYRGDAPDDQVMRVAGVRTRNRSARGRGPALGRVRSAGVLGGREGGCAGSVAGAGGVSGQCTVFARGAGLVSPGPVCGDPVGAENTSGLLRRGAPAGCKQAGCGASGGDVRDQPEGAAGAQAQGHAARAAGGERPSAGDARFRLRTGPRCGGGRCAARGARGRQGADRRRSHLRCV